MPDYLNSLEIMQRLGEIHADLKQDIGGVKAEMAGFKGAFTSDLKAATFRITAIEEDVKNDRYWYNVKTVVVIPVMLTLHKIMTAMGIRI